MAAKYVSIYVQKKDYKSEYIKEAISERELKLLEQRRFDRLNGNSKTFTWEEAKRIIVGFDSLKV